MNRIITDFAPDRPELEVYGKMPEHTLAHIYEPEPGVFIAESPKVIMRAVSAGYEPLSVLASEISGEAAEAMSLIEETSGGVDIFLTTEEEIVSLTGFRPVRGALAAMRRKALPSPEEVISDCRRIAVFEGVVNPTNVGAMIRSAAALGIDAVLLTSDCTDPLYRRAVRVSMGTVFQVKWTFLSGHRTDIDLLHKNGFACAAMALRSESVNIDNHSLKGEDKLAVILGAEGDGLSEETISASDYTVCIPMKNGVDSLNVAAASALAFWEALK